MDVSKVLSVTINALPTEAMQSWPIMTTFSAVSKSDIYVALFADELLLQEHLKLIR